MIGETRHTSYKPNAVLFQEALDKIQHRCELRKYNRLLLTAAPHLHILQQLQDHPYLCRIALPSPGCDIDACAALCHTLTALPIGLGEPAIAVKEPPSASTWNIPSVDTYVAWHNWHFLGPMSIRPNTSARSSTSESDSESLVGTGATAS